MLCLRRHHFLRILRPQLCRVLKDAGSFSRHWASFTATSDSLCRHPSSAGSVDDSNLDVGHRDGDRPAVAEKPWGVALGCRAVGSWAAPSPSVSRSDICKFMQIG